MCPDRVRLTPELVARVPLPPAGQPPAPPPEGRRPGVEDDHAEMADRLLEAWSEGRPLWIFAYGSLIWNPDFEFVERRTAHLAGWRRAFCLGWDLWFRGIPGRPGLMLALDRGGSCNGVAFRLPEGKEPANLMRLMQREVRLIPHPFPARWVRVTTAAGPIAAITFAIDRRSGGYVPPLTDAALAEVLATAAGPWGSMAEYLMNTTDELDRHGLGDGYLRRIESLVAKRLAASPSPVVSPE